MRVTPFRVLITLLITHLLSPLGLQVWVSEGLSGWVWGFRGLGVYASSQQTIRARATPGSLARRFRCGFRGLGV